MMTNPITSVLIKPPSLETTHLYAPRVPSAEAWEISAFRMLCIEVPTRLIENSIKLLSGNDDDADDSALIHLILP